MGLNTPSRRLMKSKRWQMSEDIKAGRWRYPAPAIHFDAGGQLVDGQNRMTAVRWAGTGAWFRVEFGWPLQSIEALDLGSPRNTGDVLRLHNVADALTVGSMVTTIVRYDETAGSNRSWMNSEHANFVPSAPEVKELYEQHETAMREAVHRGNRLHKALDKGLTRSVWAAAFYICARKDQPKTVEFFGAVEFGNNPNRAVVALREHAMRRRVSSYRTGDRREPLENILRAFQSFGRQDEKPGFVRQPGFKLTLLR